MIGDGGERRRLRTEFLRLRAALRDPTTGLYGFTLYFDRVRALVSRDERIGVLWIGLGGRQLVEPVFGWESYDALLRGAAEELERCVGGLLPGGTILATAAVHADAFVLFVPAEVAGTPLPASRLPEMSAALRERLRQRMLAALGGTATLGSGPLVGGALLSDNPLQRFERRVLMAIDEARALAEQPAQSERVVWVAELQRILRDGEITALYQPIVELDGEEPVAVEAFARGPARSTLHLPRVLFGLSREAGLEQALDRRCREAALTGARRLPEPLALFVNASAQGLDRAAWAEALPDGLGPERVVVELAEAALAAGDPEVERSVEALRRAGFRLSIDDVGSSPRSVALAESFRPDFLKLDLAALRGAASASLVREVVRSLARLSRRIGARLVAERIERADEREMLIRCGVGLGQGYLFGHEEPLPLDLGRVAGGELPDT